MPIINGVKYACEPCMRGHRSSKCTHEDRLLVRVRKPGRPLSSCPHLPSGAGGTTTFVDANGARLDDSTATHGHGAGGKPCGCEVTSLAIPKVAACACSVPQFSHPSSSATTPTSKSSSLELRIHAHQPFKTRVSSPPASPISPASVYSATSESSSGRISKITKKRKSISLSGEAILEIASREALLKLAGQQNAIDHGALTQRNTEPSVGLGYNGEDIHLTGTQLNHGHASMPTGQESEISQFQGSEGATVHNSSTAFYNNTAFWGQDHWRPETEAPIPPPPTAQSPAQTKSCCTGCGSKPAKLSPTVTQNQLMNQTQIQAHLPFGLPQPSTFHPMFHESMQHMQPIATTIYTYPNGYTTVNNPLTPQELRMLQATGAWSSGAAAAWSGLGVAATGHGMDSEYACSCGPECECLGCAAHPFNTSTVNFVKDMRTMMYSSRHGVPPRRQKMVAEHSAAVHGVVRQTGRCCGGGAQQRNNTVMANNVSHLDSDPNSPSNTINYGPVHSQQSFEHMPSPHQHISSPHQHVSSPHPLQQVQNIDSPLPHSHQVSCSPLSQHSASPLNDRSPTPHHTVRPHHCRPALPPNISSPAYTSGSSPDPANGEEDTETEQNTVSPSAYFHIDYPLGLCSESDMGCLCGDDCTCIGCILHENNMPDLESTLTEPIRTDALTTQNSDHGSGSTRSGSCCGGGGGIRYNPNNGVQAVRRDSQERRPSSGVINQNAQSQPINGQVSSTIRERPQVHPLLEGIHEQEVVDGQPVYVWA